MKYMLLVYGDEQDRRNPAGNGNSRPAYALGVIEGRRSSESN